MAYCSEKLQLMESSLLEVARLIGLKGTTQNKDGFVEGLNLENEAAMLTTAAEGIHEGIFRVVVMGTFNNGKSSIINALIGKRVLPEAGVPATAIVSYIRLGEDVNVHVFFKDGHKEVMSTDDFFNRFKFNADDTEECRNTGKVSRFADVQDSVVYCHMPLLENGVQILDTPGLEDKESATNTTMEAAANANAIIYTCSAENGSFYKNDISFFEENFDNRHLNNVFFLINKSDLKDDETLVQVKVQIKAQLKKVFQKEDGTFDEELFNKRVFFVSAKNTLELKLGEIHDSFKDRDIPAFQQFEEDLEEFLTTDARAKATLDGCLKKLKDAESSVKHVIDANKLVATKGKAEIERDIESVKDKLNNSETELKQIKSYFDIAISKTQAIVQNNVNGIVTTINDEWDAKLADIVENSGIGMTTLVKVAAQAVRYVGRPEQRNAAFQREIEPIVSQVNKFVNDKITDATKNIKVQTTPVLDELAQNVGTSLEHLRANWDSIITIFEPQQGENPNPDDINIFKLLGAIINEDVSTMVRLLGGDNIGWGDFLKKTIVQLFLDSLLFAIGGPIGGILFILKEWYEMKMGKNHMVEAFASKSKEQLIIELKHNLDERSGEMDSKIAETYLKMYSKIAEPLLSKIEDERTLISSLEEKYRQNDYDFNAEELRCNYILNKLQSILQIVKA